MGLLAYFRDKSAATKSVRADLAPLLGGWVKDRTLRAQLLTDDTFRYYRALENEVQLVEASPRMALLVTSPNTGDGRTSAALLMAMLSAAYAPELQTVYVDAGESRAHLSDKLCLAPNQQGFYSIMEGTATLDEALQPSPLANLMVIAGGACETGRKRFDQARFAALCTTLEKRFQRIIIDAPALGTHREVLVMSRFINNVVLVVRCRKTPRTTAVLALKDLESVGANVLGIILNARVFPLPGSRSHA